MVVSLFFKKPLNFLNVARNRIFKQGFNSITEMQQHNSNYKYLLILDLEATCDRVKSFTQEIIEFPCLKINLNNLIEEGRFHQYVRPICRPILTTFCTELTGILQETVDEAKTFPEVYEMFENWRQEEELTSNNSVYITSGDWDLGHMIPEQCTICNLNIPSHMTEWIDIKKLFGNNNEKFYNSFTDVMKYYNLEFRGRPHSGIDDCLNILQVVEKMVQLGIEFKPTSRLNNFKVETLNTHVKPMQLKSSGPFVLNPKIGKYRRYFVTAFTLFINLIRSAIQDCEEEITPPWNFSWVVEDQLAAMGWPYSEANLRFIVSQGIKHLITLSPEKLPPIRKFQKIEWMEIPIEEFEAPTLDQIVKFIQICEDCLSKNEAIGIHCRQGRGRTGVMAACFLVRFQDLAPERAIINLRLQRPGSIETPDQERSVWQYHDYLRKKVNK